MATKQLKRPRDPIALAKLIGDIATGQLTPAMAAGVSQTLWSLTDIVRVVDEWEAKDGSNRHSMDQP